MKRSKPAHAASSASGSTSGDTNPESGQLTEDLIRARAYALYEARNGESGTAQDDWMRAQNALSEELGIRASA